MAEDRTEHDRMMAICHAMLALGDLLCSADNIEMIERNREKFPTLYADIDKLMRAITKASENDDGRWNALAPWNRKL